MLAALRFALHFFHHRQPSICSSADYQSSAFPGYVLLDGKRNMSKLVAELFGRFFLALADLAAVNHHVVVAGDAIDPDGTEGKLIEAHRCIPARSRALFRCDDGKGGPALLEFLATAFRAHDVALLVVDER